MSNDLEYRTENGADVPVKKKILTRKFWNIFAIVCVVFIIVSTITIYFTMFHINKQYTRVDSLEFLPIPEQIQTDKDLNFTFENATIFMRFKATYKIQGRVVATKYYLPTSLFNRFIPNDVGLCWGNLSTKKYEDVISFNNISDRKLFYTYNKSKDPNAKSDPLNNYLSNNHLIPENYEVLKQIRNIKKDDYIQIEGHLVYVTIKAPNYSIIYNSSLSRSDHGNFSCEVIYVSNVTWLTV